MNKSQLQVKEFHEAFGVPVHLTPQCAIPKERALLRAKLIFEEAKETIEAMGCEIIVSKGFCSGQIVDCFAIALDDAGEFNLVEVVDGLCDLESVCDGAALEFGVDLEPAKNEVHRSNMSKAWTEEEAINSRPPGSSMTKIEGLIPQYAVKRADHKILKSPGYSPANIAAVLEKQRI